MPEVYCEAHAEVVKIQTELAIMFRSHSEHVEASLRDIIALLRGQPGTPGTGLSDRMTRLETQLTQTDEHVEKLVVAISGKNGESGLVGRVAKLERIWAAIIGVAIAGGITGAGFWKLLSLF